MAKKKGKKSTLISQTELERTKTNHFNLTSEGEEQFRQLLPECFWDLLAIETIDYMESNECYEYDHSFYFFDDEEKPSEEDRMTCLGAFNPANFNQIHDFLYSPTGFLEERGMRYGIPDYDVEEISTVLESTIYDRMEEEFEDLIRHLITLESSSDEPFFTQEVIVKYKQIRKSNQTHELYENLLTQTEEEPISLDLTDETSLSFLIHHLKENLQDIVGEELSEWMSDIGCEKFYDLCLRGCELLEKPIDDLYPTIQYKNTPLQQAILQHLTDLFVENEAFRKTLISSLPSPLNYEDKKIVSTVFKNQKTLANDQLLQNVLTESLRQVVLQTNEVPIPTLLQLMAGIYAYQLEQHTKEDEVTQLSRLHQALAFKEVQQAWLIHGLIYALDDLYPELLLREDVKAVLPDHPNDYYPQARTLKRHFILHVGETNTGKTHFSLERFKQAETGIYLAPLRLLALEVQERLTQQEIPCNLLTGEEFLTFNQAHHTSCTIELLDVNQIYEVAVIDEAQMIGDPFRGSAWTTAILGVCAKEIHVCLAPYALNLIQKLIEGCDDSYEIIEHHRESELNVTVQAFDFVKDTQPGDALVVFSKRKVLNVAAKLMKERQLPCSLLYGSLPYRNRRKQFQDFLTQKTEVLVTTDAIGMGVNLPIKRVILLEDQKFDGKNTRPLQTSELKQIGGRAGRKGMYEIGEFILPNKKTLNIFHQSIPALEKAPIGLTPHLKTIPNELREVLSGWLQLEFPSPFEKANISHALQRLFLSRPFQLTKEQQYKTLFLPVDPFNEHQRDLLVFYFQHLKAGANQLPLPSRPPLYYHDQLRQLEDYDKTLDLYDAFSRTFNLLSNRNFLEQERLKISEAINQQLLAKELQVATCNQCGKEMAWDSHHYKCQHCYEQNRYSYYQYDSDWDDEEDFI